MNKIIQKFQWLQLLLGFILLSLGVLTIFLIAQQNENYESTVFVVWSVTLFVIAAIIIIFDLVAFNKTAEFGGLIASGICIGIGLFILINRTQIRDAISTLLPYILISIGGVLLLKTIVLAVKRVSFKDWMLPFVLSIVFLTSGIVFLCVSNMEKVVYISIGILFIVLGAVEIIGYITYVITKRSLEKEGRNNGKIDKPVKTGKKKGKKEVDGELDYSSSSQEPVPEIEVVDAHPKVIEHKDEDNQE